MVLRDVAFERPLLLSYGKTRKVNLTLDNFRRQEPGSVRSSSVPPMAVRNGIAADELPARATTWNRSPERLNWIRRIPAAHRSVLR